MPSPPKRDANRAEKIAFNKRAEKVAWREAMIWAILKRHFLLAFQRGEEDEFRQSELKRVNDALAARMHNPDSDFHNNLFARKRALEFLLQPAVVTKRNKELEKVDTTVCVKTTTPTGTPMCQEREFEVGGEWIDPVHEQSKSPGLRISTRAAQSGYEDRVLQRQEKGDLLLAGDDTDMADSSAAGGGGGDVKKIRQKQLRALIDKFQKQGNFKQFWTSCRSKSGALYFQHIASARSCWPVDFRQVCHGTHSKCWIPEDMPR